MLTSQYFWSLYVITSITKFKLLGGYRVNLPHKIEVYTWSMFQFHHVPCSVSTFKPWYDEEMLCFMFKITHLHLNSPVEGVTHIVNPCCWFTRLTPIHQCFTQQPLFITFLHHIVNPSRVHAGIIQGFNVWINMNMNVRLIKENMICEWLWTS